jgi:hypothetical protein
MIRSLTHCGNTSAELNNCNFVSLEATHHSLQSSSAKPDYYIGRFSNFCVGQNFVFPTKGRDVRQSIPRFGHNYICASFFLVHDSRHEPRSDRWAKRAEILFFLTSCHRPLAIYLNRDSYATCLSSHPSPSHSLYPSID